MSLENAIIDRSYYLWEIEKVYASSMLSFVVGVYAGIYISQNYDVGIIMVGMENDYRRIGPAPNRRFSGLADADKYSQPITRCNFSSRSILN
ncbi:hypothetical protein NQ317_016485 [Molorchus minor]|uniref:Uncharacterized protein n=1 Tax=Molorchus minor TaxID=1323400 RepID=A0ABQ9JG48_9CUCU|nr:hypothetical protein NQ317_016485 [Molorchus minor]